MKIRAILLLAISMILSANAAADWQAFENSSDFTADFLADDIQLTDEDIALLIEMDQAADADLFAEAVNSGQVAPITDISARRRVRRKGHAPAPTENTFSGLGLSGFNSDHSFASGGSVAPVKGPVISKIGDRRGKHRRHQGVDIAASRGTPIYAAWSGVVVRAGWNRLGGWAVSLKHADGKTSYYAHMDRPPQVQKGQTVSKGAQLGVVGDSGGAKGTPTHLHFEVRSNRRVMNPMQYL